MEDLCSFYAQRITSLSKQAGRHDLCGWLDAANSLYTTLTTPIEDTEDAEDCEEASLPADHKKLQELHETLSAELDGFWPFSRQQCRKELPYALSQYQADLPSLYRKAEHQAALARALKSFRVSACGPALQFYVKRLVDECEQKWKSGRQLCEATSVSGNRCALPIHSVPGELLLASVRQEQTITDLSLVKTVPNTLLEIPACLVGAA